MPTPSPYARRLRREQTDVEQRVWLAVRARRLGGFKFRRQHTVDPYVLDFACTESRVAVELDGSQHTPEADAARTRNLEGRGWQVLRFWNNDVIGNLDGVLLTILAACEARSALTQPSPAKAGEGY